MSSKRKTQKEEVAKTEVVEVEAEVVDNEATDETPQPEKKEEPKKGMFRRILPYAIGAGAVLAAFFLGKKSSNDDLYMERLEAEYGGDSDESAAEDDTEADEVEESNDEEV